MLLFRYIFKEVFLAVLLASGGFAFVLVVAYGFSRIFENAFDGRISFGTATELTLIAIPAILPIALTAGFLMGVSSLIIRLHDQGELTAMFSNGSGIFKLTASVFLLGALATALSLPLSLNYKSFFKNHLKNLIINATGNNPLRFIKPGVFIKDFPDQRIFVKNRSGNHFQELLIWNIDKSGHVESIVQAKAGKISHKNKALLFELKNGSLQNHSHSDYQKNSEGIISFETFNSDIDLSLDKKYRSKSFSYMNFKELSRHHKAAAKLNPSKKNLIQQEIQERIALAFGPLAMALLAIPIGMHFGRRGSIRGLSWASLALLIYFTAFFAISSLKHQHHLRPDILIWAPHALLVLIFLAWISRFVRH